MPGAATNANPTMNAILKLCIRLFLLFKFTIKGCPEYLRIKYETGIVSNGIMNVGSYNDKLGR